MIATRDTNCDKIHGVNATPKFMTLRATVTEKQGTIRSHRRMRGGKGIICKMPRLEVTYEARENVNKWNREQKLKQIYIYIFKISYRN